MDFRRYEPGELAYEIYRDHTGGLPAWSDLPAPTQKAWVAAADAVIEQCFHRMAEPEPRLRADLSVSVVCECGWMMQFVGNSCICENPRCARHGLTFKRPSIELELAS